MNASSVRDHEAGPGHLWVALLPAMAFAGLVWGLAHHPLPWQAELPWVPSLAACRT